MDTDEAITATQNTMDVWTTAIPNRTPSLIIISTIFLLLTTAFFTTRLAWRWAHSQRGWDDLMAAAAYITLLVQTAFGYRAAQEGFGKHRADTGSHFPRAMFWFWLYQICYKLLGGLTKLTFCLLYYRLFTQKPFQRCIIFVGSVIAAGTVAFTLGTVLQCTPIHRNWDQRVEGYCVDFMGFWFSHAAFNTFMDMVIFLLPIPMIRTLQMAHKTKVGLMSIFALGAFTIAASIVRMVMLRDSARSTQDPTWGSLPALVWTEIEANTAVICCCLPALRVLAVRIWRGMTGQNQETTTGASDASHPKSTSRGRKPALPKDLGIFSNARYSPSSSPGPGHRPSPNAGRFARLFSTTKKKDRDDPEQGRSTPHPLHDIQIFRSREVEVTTNRDSKYHYPPKDPAVAHQTKRASTVSGEQGNVSLDDMLRTR